MKSNPTEEEKSEDLRLRGIAAEIEEIFKKHDVAGHVTIASPLMAHWLYSLSPSWSIANLEDGKLELKCTKEQGYTQEQMQQRITDTVSMFSSMMNTCDHATKNFMSILLTLATKFDTQTTMEQMPQPDSDETDADSTPL